MNITCFQITRLPDLSLNKYQCLADTGIPGVLKRHESFLRQWHGICKENLMSFHLLYAYLPSESVGQRLKVFFLMQGSDNDLKLVEPLLQKSPLSDFFSFEKGKVPLIYFEAGATMTKKERIAVIYNPMIGQSKAVHYVPKLKMNEGARLYDLLRIMETVGQLYLPQHACAFRLDLYPTSVEQDTRIKFRPVLKELHGENDIKLMRETDSLSADNYARDICKEFEGWLTNIETNPHFRVNIYAFGNEIFKSKVLLNAAASEALSEGDFSIEQIRPDADGSFNLLSRLTEQAGDYCFYPDQATLKSWSTTYSLSEVVPFFRFPTLYDGETIEIPKETALLLNQNGIYLGKDTNGYPVKYMLEDLPKHAFFTGTPGSGKTNTMLHLATELWKNKIPFLVLEPAKKEYRALLGHKEMQDIHLFSPHLQSKFPLQMNPMEFPKGVRLSEHINALLEVFEGSFVLEGPTYKFLSSSIQLSYTKLGWDIEDVNTECCNLRYPKLQNVYDNLQHEIDASSYSVEIKGNVRAFLQVRLGSLMERDTGEVFNVNYSTLKPEDWLRISAIVELEVLGEQAKNFFVLLVCHYILESLRAMPNGGVDKNGNLLPVRHVVFIEEAHNIIAPSARQAYGDLIDPKISATAYIVKMLAEVRALREAIVIADQLPTALASEITKNTGLKLVHRLTAQDDRQQIGNAISASPLQLERMASFSSGQAFIYHERIMKPFEIQVTRWLLPEIAFDYADDGQLYSELRHSPLMKNAVRVALSNWKDNCLLVVNEKIKKLQERYKNCGDNTAVRECILIRTRLSVECKKLHLRCKLFKETWIIVEDEDCELCRVIDENISFINGMLDNLDVIRKLS